MYVQKREMCTMCACVQRIVSKCERKDTKYVRGVYYILDNVYHASVCSLSLAGDAHCDRSMRE